MKGRNGSTAVEITQVHSEELKHRESRRGWHWFSATEWLSQRRLRAARLAFAVVALVTAFLLGAFFVSYGSKLYRTWRENRLLDQATALLQQGELSEAAQKARELLARNPDSLPTLSILAETA